MAERELSFVPDLSQGQGRNYKERPTPHPKTLRFLNDARVNGVFYSLPEETRHIIDVYYYSDSGLKDLRGLVHPKTGAQVKSVIFQALKDVWEKLPSEIRERNPLDDVLKLKHQSYSQEHAERMKNPSEETRKKISEKALERGFPPGFEEKRLRKIRGKHRSLKTKRRIARTLTELWSDPSYREERKKTFPKKAKERISRALADRDIDRKLWSLARNNDELSDFFTVEEIDTLRNVLELKKETRMPSAHISALIDRLSIFVANKC